jgi:hypothetical protein
MLVFEPEKDFFFISEGGKTLYIRQFMVFNDNKYNTSANFKLLFRRQNGQWILTR